MKPFKFQKFVVNQSEEVFRVGTDGVLLGALSCASAARSILEIGAGTGVISLMLAQRNPEAEITAMDINESAVRIAEENFKNSPFSERLKVSHSDFKIFQTEEKFDLIVSNPPYFERNSSVKDILARQKVELNFSDLIKKSTPLISERGILSVIIPFESGTEFEDICIEEKLCLIRKINISGIKNSKPKRLVLEFSKTCKPLKMANFTIEQSPRKYSEQYLESTKDFHVFGR